MVVCSQGGRQRQNHSNRINRFFYEPSLAIFLESMEIRVFATVDTLGATAADITSRVKVKKSGERTTNTAWLAAGREE